ncbi:MAG: hypothetical protein F6J95_025270 [Leptolyngbya sp. SIO1E4]|nr:hypothetical protein [Leptolyngbya sp. SIO1E4]
MNNLYQLIQHQASYAELVAWMQKQEQCNYLQACLKVNQELRQYRLQYPAREDYP